MKYDEDYFERGIVTGLSNYSNYRWIPELTIPMVMTMIDFLGINRTDKILDYGAAKGYIVKAFKWLGRHAIGVDVSMYAINNCDKEVEDRIFHVDSLPNLFEDFSFEWIIAKDVFEHIDYSQIKKVLSSLNANRMFAIIPMGENNRYFHRYNDADKTHVIREDYSWWITKFQKSGWALEDFRYEVRGIKDAYYDEVPKAHGFFTLKRLQC